MLKTGPVRKDLHEISGAHSQLEVGRIFFNLNCRTSKCVFMVEIEPGLSSIDHGSSNSSFKKLPTTNEVNVKMFYLQICHDFQVLPRIGLPFLGNIWNVVI